MRSVTPLLVTEEDVQVSLEPFPKSKKVCTLLFTLLSSTDTYRHIVSYRKQTARIRCSARWKDKVSSALPFCWSSHCHIAVLILWITTFLIEFGSISFINTVKNIFHLQLTSLAPESSHQDHIIVKSSSLSVLSSSYSLETFSVILCEVVLLDFW